MEFAKTLSFSYHRSYQVVTVTPPGATAERYVLVHCGAPKPALTGTLAGAQVITTPVTSLYSASTTHLPSLVELGTLNALTGVSSTAFVSEEPVLDYIARHKVAQFSPKGTIDAETVIKAKPQLLVEGGFPDPADTKLKAAGVPVLQDQDASETDPLGEAEWIKFFAALTGTEKTATAAFGRTVSSYRQTAKLVAGASKVQIVPGNPYQGSWYVPGGKSYKAKLFADAGGTTAWAADTSTASIKTSFEQVYAKASKAPVWLAATTWTTEKQALAEDPRLATFAAFAAHNVWDPVKGVTAAGGNPAYELAAVRPDLMLGDLVAILHPDLLPHHLFAFYAKLT
ncbi:MAG: ABC transporter substrate-binding protein [Actinomycetota bacterium]|nr:ABC transporter substrate-binding protein [Actinomycetota bacterium]